MRKTYRHLDFIDVSVVVIVRKQDSESLCQTHKICGGDRDLVGLVCVGGHCNLFSDK